MQQMQCNIHIIDCTYNIALGLSSFPITLCEPKHHQLGIGSTWFDDAKEEYECACVGLWKGFDKYDMVNYHDDDDNVDAGCGDGALFSAVSYLLLVYDNK